MSVECSRVGSGNFRGGWLTYRSCTGGLHELVSSDHRLMILWVHRSRELGSDVATLASVAEGRAGLKRQHADPEVVTG